MASTPAFVYSRAIPKNGKSLAIKPLDGDAFFHFGDDAKMIIQARNETRFVDRMNLSDLLLQSR